MKVFQCPVGLYSCNCTCTSSVEAPRGLDLDDSLLDFLVTDSSYVICTDSELKQPFEISSMRYQL